MSVSNQFLSNGISLDKNGLEPDIIVAQSTSTLDAQLDKAIETLNK